MDGDCCQEHGCTFKIRRGPFTGRVFLVTDYRTVTNSVGVDGQEFTRLEALRKHDITASIEGEWEWRKP